MGAADAVRAVHHGPNHLLEVSENQRPHIQRHVEGRRDKRKEGRKEGRKVGKCVDEERKGGKEKQQLVW